MTIPKISGIPAPKRLRDLRDVDPAGLVNGDLPTYDSGSDKFTMDPGSSGGVVTAYTPVLTNVINTASRSRLIRVTIPANTWADGEKVEIEWFGGTFNDTGASRSTKIEAEVAGRVIADRTQSISDSFGGGAGDAARFNEDRNLFRLMFRRQGATDNNAEILYGGYASGDVASAPRNPTGMFATANDFTHIDPTDGDPNDGYPNSQLGFGQHQFAHDFTADINLDLYVTFPIASPDLFIKAYSGRAWKQ